MKRIFILLSVMVASVIFSFAQTNTPVPNAPVEIIVAFDHASGPSMTIDDLKKTKMVVVFQQDYEVVSFSLIIMNESKGEAPVNLTSTDNKLTKEQLAALQNCAKGDRVALEPVIIRKKGSDKLMHAHGAIYSIM